ncbi:Exodeoxyribonuclease 7 large subunit [Rubripirellula lacrimiformis]|uniref:Exodeoxyribonuclease 7 large subunit n=1 Tax=Rubripirellula lacrimiformis TaxID=1930273 RepID=A0A517NHR6_9BACT|nr:exodeoxyribonuclease VII large subunit [Rubripirellula lacrimiformis]QDT06679.1 Exodeoxyribonuclease 7 large subunit [Rubripirellula lacrimiformis]
MNATAENAVSVSELTHHIKAILEGTFPSIWVSGEVSDLSRPRSGHLYFTLKDDNAHIRGVIWRGTAARLGVDIADGQSVFCFGDVEVYAARGTYQLVIRKVQNQGVGALQQAFEKLQAKLHAEGLFAAERKRPLPRHPRRIGVITSPSGAAIRDFLEAASARFKGVELFIIPAIVQGPTAAKSIVSAIAKAHRYRPTLDALILTRGGGSLEDLWCFNEEPVVRSVAAATIPTVSAVGHEIDITLCDLAADVRALTPTDAATRILPDAKMFDRSVLELQRRLQRSAQHMIQSRRERLEYLAERPAIRKPHQIVHLRSRSLDEWDARARRVMFSKIKLGQAKLAAQAAALSALSPLNVLTRGYSVTLDEQGNAVENANQVQPGDVLRTRVHQGQIESVVRTVHPD